MKLGLHYINWKVRKRPDEIDTPLGYHGRLGLFFNNTPPWDMVQAAGMPEKPIPRRTLCFGFAFGRREVGVYMTWPEAPKHTFSEIQADKFRRGIWN